MAKETTNVSIRMDVELKKQAEQLLSEFGMNLTTAFTVFLRQMIRQGKIPFEIGINTPNAETIAAMMEVDEGRNLSQTFDKVEDLMRDLDA